MSENSSARTCVTAEDSEDTMRGNFSVIPPGWIPDPCNVTPPAIAASSIALTFGWVRSGYTQPIGVTTFLPERRIAQTSSSSATSGLYITQSASRARMSSTLDVAVTPIGSAPRMSPTSRPLFELLSTQHPPGSSWGGLKPPSVAAFPPPPVAHWITLNWLMIGHRVSYRQCVSAMQCTFRGFSVTVRMSAAAAETARREPQRCSGSEHLAPDYLGGGLQASGLYATVYACMAVTVNC